MQKSVVRYSEAFKLRVVQELEEGLHRSCRSAEQAYGIRGNGTVQRWARQFGRGHVTTKLVRVEMPEDRDELRRLRGRVRELERALGDATLELRFERKCVNLACLQAGISNTEEFRQEVRGNLAPMQGGILEAGFRTGSDGATAPSPARRVEAPVAARLGASLEWHSGGQGSIRAEGATI